MKILDYSTKGVVHISTQGKKKSKHQHHIHHHQNKALFKNIQHLLLSAFLEILVHSERNKQQNVSYVPNLRQICQELREMCCFSKTKTTITSLLNLKLLKIIVFIHLLKTYTSVIKIQIHNVQVFFHFVSTFLIHFQIFAFILYLNKKYRSLL